MEVIKGKRMYGDRRFGLIEENPELCVREIWPYGWWYGRQCQRKRGFGWNGLYCKQHSSKENVKSEQKNG